VNKIASLILLLTASAGSLRAQEVRRTPKPLDPTIKARVDRIFTAYDKSSSPGCALGVVRDGQLIYRTGYGSANLDFRLPITPNSVFDIGSTSKQFSALAILLLEQDGKLGIDDDIRQVIPEIPKYADGTITIRHLLQHTSGLRDYLTLSRLALHGPDDFYTDDDVLAMIARQKELNFAPGSDFLYSNSGFFLLSTIVKRVSGKSLRQFTEDRILKPLNMNTTHFHDDHTEIVRNRATGYQAVDGVENKFRINMSTLDMVGDGGIYTSVADLFKFDQNFYTGKVGGKDLLARMQTSGKLTSGKPIDYGLGLFMSTYRGLPTVAHGGSWAGFRAELLRHPDQNFSVICLCNLASADPSRLARQVADVFLESSYQVPPPAPVSPASKPKPADTQKVALEPYAGKYRCDELGGVIYEISADGTNLRVVHRNGWTLRPVGNDKFDARQLQVQFERGPDGSVKSFVAQAGRVRNIRFERML
jgi:CubicO group peptidase (beta-lactamase class C family)